MVEVKHPRPVTASASLTSWVVNPVPRDDRRRPEPPASAAPSVGARALAVLAILIAGACGGLIGYAVIDLLYDSSAASATGTLVGALGAAAGVAVIVNLTLQSMAEWRSIQERDRRRSSTRSS